MDDQTSALDAAWKNVFMFFYGLYNNFIRNSIHMWDDMTMVGYIRLVVIIGGYLLIRPYLVGIGERIQGRQHKDAEVEDEKTVKISANDLRGGGKKVEKEEKGRGKDGKKKGVSWGDEGSDSEKEATGADIQWGKKARKRQRQVEKKLEEQERKLRGDDVMDLLVDYEDGWDN